VRGKIRVRLLVATSILVSSCVYVSLALVGGSRGALALGVALAAGAAVGLIVSELSVRWFDDTVRPLTDAARRMHEGDLTVRARIAREQDVGQLGASFDQLAGSLSRTVGELRSERDLVSRILDGMQEGVLLLDKDGKVALMNPALREMLLLRADLVGHPLLEVVRHAELKELLDRARLTGTTCSGEVELGGLKPRRLLVRGTAFTERGSVSPPRPGRPRGAVAENGGGMLAVFFDVTDIRRLESLRRDFVANVSHELRTPVTAILSAAETMQTALDRDPEGAKRFLAIVERNAARLQRLIEDLLDLSRIESRELRLRPERFAFESFATHLLGMFRERAEKRKIALRLETAKGLEVDADRRALEQVLTNLVDNAVKYCPEGCSVVVHAEPAEAPATGVLLRVEDDGPGIEQKHLSRLFERFYRVDAGRSREMGGTGLGLAIVKHLVEAMGGAIVVASTVGKGTTFEVSLPDASTRGRDRSSDDVNQRATASMPARIPSSSGTLPTL
jgi:two-component system phosphate regulon sensor histidine kinase PhoR